MIIPLLVNNVKRFAEKGRQWGGVIFLFSLAMHFLFLLDGRNDPTFLRPIVDAQTYHGFACQLADGQYHPNTPYYQPPFFAYLLAAVYFIFGKSVIAAKCVLAFLGALTPLFCYLIGKQLFSKKTGILAGLIAALYGPLLFYDSQFLPAGLATLLNIIFLWLLLRAAERDRWPNWLLAGLCAGVAASTVPNILFFLPFVLIWIKLDPVIRQGNFFPIPRGRARRPCLPAVLPARSTSRSDVGRRSALQAGRAVRYKSGSAGGFALPTLKFLNIKLGLRPGMSSISRFLLVVIGAACMIAPVTIHNYTASGRFTLISHNGGLNFYIGNNLDAEKTIAIRPSFGWENLDKLPARSGVFNAVDAERFYYRKTFAYIAKNPGHFLRHLFQKIRQATNARELPRNVDIYVFREYYLLLRPLVWRLGSFGFPFGILFPLACWGMIAGLRRNRASLLLALFAGAYVFSIALFFVSGRYRLVVVPALCVFAAYALDWRQWMGRLSLRSLWPVLAVFFAALLWSNTPVRAPTDHIPFKAEMFNFLGLQRVNPADYAGAEAELREALRIAPDYATAWNSLGFIYRRKGDWESARAADQHAARVAPDYAEAFNGLGLADEKLGRPTEAEQAFRRAIELSPDTSGPYVNLGRLLYYQSRRREAVPVLRQAIHLDITAQEAYGLLAWILATAPEDDLRDGRTALQYAHFLIRWQGADDPMRMDTLAAAYAETGDFLNARKTAERAVALWKASGRDDIRAQAAQRLELYRQSKPARE